MRHPIPRPGTVQQLAPGLRCVLAPNPSPMTHWGTNTYIIGHYGALVVIDPGPDDPRHLAALLAAIGDSEVSHIIVTHSHLDHSPLAGPLSQATGAPTVGFGPATAGRSAAMQALVKAGMTSGGEGIDHAFTPDITVQDGDVIREPDMELVILHTPGHLGNHICIDWQGTIFTGDHVMGWASSLVSPPDGDLTDFMASCQKLAQRPTAAYYPGHGAPVHDAANRLGWLIHHRQSREAQILTTLHHHPDGLTPAQLTALIYADTPAHLHPAAERNVLAHLIDLVGQKKVHTPAPLSETSTFHATR